MLRLFRKFVFKLFYSIYVWSLSSDSHSPLPYRMYEYPYILNHLLNDVPLGGKVLVVGCSTDILSTLIPSFGYETCGLDIKHASIQYDNFTFIQEDIRQTRFPSNSFDAIVAVSTIEHVGMHDEDPAGDKKAILEIKRILKVNGNFYFSVPIASMNRTLFLERIYDPSSLTLLVLSSGLSIIEEQYLKGDEHGYLTECKKNELPSPDTSIGVALLFTKKPKPGE